MQKFITFMRVQKLSDATIQKRVELLHRLAEFLPVRLLDATPDMLLGFQASFAHRAPASVHVYTRHVTAFYRWALESELIEKDPSTKLRLPRIPKTIPHPTGLEDLRVIFLCARARLRTAYVLASFTGMRCAEICRMRSSDITWEGKPTALVHGKGGKERRVVLLPPVVEELGYRKGWIITRDDGSPVDPLWLSGESTRFLRELGMDTTLHSMRGTFATHAVRLTHDVMLVKELLGHESLNTTQIYTESTLEGAHEKLAAMSELANTLLRPAHLTAISA